MTELCCRPAKPRMRLRPCWWVSPYGLGIAEPCPCPCHCIDFKTCSTGWRWDCKANDRRLSCEGGGLPCSNQLLRVRAWGREYGTWRADQSCPGDLGAMPLRNQKRGENIWCHKSVRNYGTSPVWMLLTLVHNLNRIFLVPVRVLFVCLMCPCLTSNHVCIQDKIATVHPATSANLQ